MTPETLFRVLEETWPAAAMRDQGPFRLRDGAGGGKRVSAANAIGPWLPADLDAAEAAMEQPLFLIRDGAPGGADAALDAALAARGYRIVDPVQAHVAPVQRLAGDLPFLSTFPHWPPLGIAREIWAEGGIGPARLAVMDRVTGPKTAILSRVDDRPAGVAFVALSGDQAMLHALDVTPAQRRKGTASHILRAAANWAQDHGATHLSLVVTRQNSAAIALYTAAGMDVEGGYHYRMK